MSFPKLQFDNRPPAGTKFRFFLKALFLQGFFFTLLSTIKLQNQQGTGNYDQRYSRFLL